MASRVPQVSPDRTERRRHRLDLLGAAVAIVIYVSSIATFAGRMVFGLPAGHWIGTPLLLTVVPLGCLLGTARSLGRRPLYSIQLALMITFLVVLFLLDYVLAVEWRDTRWAVIGFVTLYFGALGGMIGVAAEAGRRWMLSAVGLFMTTAVLAFVQRAVTGL